MNVRLTRRAMLTLPLAFAACEEEDETPRPVTRRDYPPLRYGYLPPISLNVQRVETADGFTPGPAEGELIGLSPIDPADTLFAMARDRLKPVGTSGIATFRIINASIIRHRDTLNGMLAVRLDVRDADGTNSGFAEARVTANHTGPIADQRAAVYDMLKSMMDNMNVEFEYQIRNKLRTWVVVPPGEATPRQPLPSEPPPPPRPEPEPPEPGAQTPPEPSDPLEPPPRN